MVKAKITVFDDETGREYEKDRVIPPQREETFIGPCESAYLVKEYEFRFEFKRLI